MTEKEYILTCIMEECAEIIQACSKIIRFGEANFNPYEKPSRTNTEKLILEIMDFMALIQLDSQLKVSPSKFSEHIEEKQRRVMKMYKDFYKGA